MDVERIRYQGEATAAETMEANAWLKPLIANAPTLPSGDPERVRHRLMSTSLRLTEGMAGEAWGAAQRAAEALGVETPFEIYQAAGIENAGIHLVDAPVLMEVRGSLLTLLGPDELAAVFGHELGHYLAHGTQSPHAHLGVVAHHVVELGAVPELALRAASAFLMAREITADRYGLLAIRDLDAALRLEMALATGLAVDALAFDPDVYLEQCKGIVATHRSRGEHARGVTHPEHGVRAWALWCFSESDLYHELTGQGPGTRPIAEVDAEIAEVLGGTALDGLRDSALALEPIPEVHQCALACAVMVALADNTIDDDELHAIETVFAPLVTDWQRYLSWDNAHEAFVDTGAVISRGGVRLQQGVFQVMVQVMLADGDASAREIEMVAAIGDALGCGTLFRALLTPVLTSIGVEGVDLDKVTKVIPMPAREDEANAALNVFFGGVAERGTGQTSVRHLLRLLGETHPSEDALGRLVTLREQHGLLADPPIAEATLDQLLTLTLDPERVAADDGPKTPPPPMDEARRRLAAALGRLRDQLVSGDGRSPSIRLRRPRTGRAFDLMRLDDLSVGHALRVVTLLQGGEEARVVDGREVGIHEGAERVARELVALEREALARFEESGAQDLYLGTPFVTGVFRGYLVRAPLVLVPVDAVRVKGAGHLLRPADRPTIVNQALVRLLFTKKGASYPDALSEALDQAAEEGTEAVLTLLAEHGVVVRRERDELHRLEPRDEDFATWINNRVVIEACAVVGFFPQSRSDMIHDYSRLLEAVESGEGDVAELLGAAGALLPAELRDAVGISEVVEAHEGPLHTVVPADPSQLQVLDDARRARALVVDGPPGTGKSQVIVNLVSDALAAGQSVAVVCEKRAALDVVAQRLETVGLGHLMALVHHTQSDRRALYDRIVRRLSDSHHRDHDVGAARRDHEELQGIQDALGERRAALAQALGDEPPSLGQLHLVEASLPGDPLEGLDPSVARLSLSQVRDLAARIGREAPHVDLYTEDSPWRAPMGARPSLAALSPDDRVAVETALRDARGPAAAYDEVSAPQPVGYPEVVGAGAALEAALATQAARQEPAGRDVFMAMLAAGASAELAEATTSLQSTWADPTWSDELTERVRFKPEPGLENALAVIERRSGVWWRFFLLSWWRARKLVRLVLASQWPVGLAHAVDKLLVRRIRDRERGAKAFASLDTVLGLLGVAAVVDTTGAAQSWVRRILATWEATRPLLAHRPTLERAKAWPADAHALTTWDTTLDERTQLLDTGRAAAAAFAGPRMYFPWTDEAPSTGVVATLHQAWARDAARVVRSDRNLDAAAEHVATAREVVHVFADALPGDGPGIWRDTLERTWARMRIADLERMHPAVTLLDRPTPWGEVAEAERKLAEATRAVLGHHVTEIAAERDRIPLLTLPRPKKGARRTPEQKARESMLREASKKRYVLSMRAYVREFAKAGLTSLLPVWLVSPETMAVLFDAEQVFDLVVVDEASQCTVEKGFPALVRGKRAVVAGDEKQMPPTKFFELGGTDEDDLVSSEEILAEDALSAESLLVLARERCPHTGLTWHYRCEREELIAFSNYSMYGGDLMTIPATATAAAPPALRWVAVEDGAYDRGANPIEGARVVEVIDELLRQDPAPSVGVVTFNIQQQRVIQDLIDERRAADEAFGERWARAVSADDLDERPFVKNLESVQGDERDVIIFSLGHAPTERQSGRRAGERYVPARFGPLGQRGGERRLNVAVSRAKQGCVVVSSFEPHLLTVAHTAHEGPRLLKAFLEFVHQLSGGQRLLADKTLERVRHGSLGLRERREGARFPVPSLAAQIAEALGDRYSYDLGLGSSGFQIPLAIRATADADHYAVAILTDDGGRVGDVDEEHLHYPTVLGMRGWQVLRVTSREWDQDRDRVLDRVHSALDAAIALVDVGEG